jgi:putative two-component system response regulator
MREVQMDAGGAQVPPFPGCHLDMLLGGAGAQVVLPLAASWPVPGHESAPERAAIEDVRRHGRRLSVLSAGLGRYLGLTGRELRVLRLGSLLHDVGKLSIPPATLFKHGQLSAEEFETVKAHPVIGDALCARVRELKPVRPIVRHHHERLDGSGYPDGLSGAQIPLLAQIVGVVDVYDALIESRPYKPAFERDRAIDILCREAEIGWRDATLVDALGQLVSDGELEWELSTAC